MNGALEILRRERDDAAEQIRMLRLRIKDLDTALSVLEDQPIAIRQGRALGNIKLSVLSKLSDFGPDGGTPKELAEALTRDGRTTSDASVSSTLSRLKGESKVINRNGRWFVVNAPESKSSELASGGNSSLDWEDLEDDVPF